jgi:WD40 repeat protein
MKPAILISFIWLFCSAIAGNAQALRLGLPEGHTDDVRLMAFSNDGAYVITAGDDKSVRIWETGMAKLIFTINLSALATHVQFHPSGKWFLVATYDSTYLYDAVQGNKRWAVSGSQHAAFTPDGKFIVHGEHLEKLDLNGKKVASSKLAYVQGFVQTNDGKLLSGYTGDSVYTMDAVSFRILYGIKIKLEYLGDFEKDPWSQMSFSSDSKMLLMIREDSTLEVVESYSGKPVMHFKASKRISSARFHPLGRFVVLTQNDDEIRFFDTHSGKIVKRLPAKDFSASDALYSSDGKFLLVASYDSTRIWNNQTGTVAFSYSNTDMNRFSPDGRFILTHKTGENWAALRRSEDGRLEDYLYAEVASVSFIPADNNLKPMISSVYQNVIRMWDPNTGKQLLTLEGHKDYVNDIHFSPEGNYIFTTPNGDSKTDCCARLWDAATGKLLFPLYEELPDNARPELYWHSRFTPDGKKLMVSVGRGRNGIDVFELPGGKLLYSIEDANAIALDFHFSADGLRFAASANQDTVKIYETETGKLLEMLPGFAGYLNYAGFHNHDSLLIVQDTLITVMRADDKKVLYKLPGNSVAPLDGALSFSPDGNRFIAGYDSALHIIELATGRRLLRIPGGEEDFYKVKWSPSGKYILAKYGDRIRVYRSATGMLITQIDKDIELSRVKFTGNDEYLVINDHYTTFFDLEKGKVAASLYGVGAEYIVYLPSGYYQASPGAAKYLYYVQGNHAIGFEQLDLKFNRPDLVQREIGPITGRSDTAMAGIFYKAYQKRLARQQVDISALSKTNSLPQADIIQREKLPNFTQNGTVELHIQARDTAAKIASLNVWVNEVPIYGVRGLDLSARKISAIDTVITLQLSQNANRIEAGVTNSQGMESFRRPLQIRFKPEIFRKPRIYFIGIGINHYADSSMNLSYAAKDVLDLAYLFKKRYPDCVVDTFMNAAATRENISSIAARLKNTHIEDIVLLSFSGHGMLDDSLNFYCATHDMDFENPAAKGLSYDALEQLLSAAPARKKLLLIDACNSGEADREQAGGMKTGTPNEPDKPTTGARAIKVNYATGSADDSFEMMRQVFANTTDRNGLVVISAAGAKEYAFELKDLDNGVFTWCFKNGLFEGMADTDGWDGVTVNELKTYISREVQALTNGRQKPTARKENLVYDWSLSNFSEGISSSAKAANAYDSALYWNKKGNREREIFFYGEALESLKADSNNQNLDYAILCGNLAALYQASGDTTNAFVMWFEASAVLENFAPRSQQHAYVLGNIADLYNATGNYSEAVIFHQRRQLMQMQLDGERSRPVAYTLNAIGNVYFNEDRLDSAMEYYRQSLDILDKLGRYNVRSTESEDREYYTAIMGNLAAVYRTLRMYEKELPLREDLYSIKDFYGDPDDEPKYMVINKWAMAAENASQPAMADSLYLASIALMEKADSIPYNDLRTVLGNRAFMMKKIGLYGLSLEVFEKILVLCEQYYGRESEAYAYYLNEAGVIKEKLDDRPGALEAYRESAHIYQSLLGTDSKSYKVISGNLERLENKPKTKNKKR